MKKKHMTRGKYACEICEKLFRKSKTLRRHIRQDHDTDTELKGPANLRNHEKKCSQVKIEKP